MSRYRHNGYTADIHGLLNKFDVEEEDLSLFVELHLVDKDAEISEETAREVIRGARSDGCAKSGQRLNIWNLSRQNQRIWFLEVGHSEDLVMWSSRIDLS